jgi:hypothetical protein
MTFNDFIKSINKETCTDENGYPYYQTYQLKEAFEAGQKEAAINCVQYLDREPRDNRGIRHQRESLLRC